MRSPVESSPETIDFRRKSSGMATTSLDEEDTSLAQLSYAPATQTTVVTTTTTTTTSFPPFLMRAPEQLKKRDPEKYPLAACPTPQSIRRFRFDINGQSTYFEEADDAPKALSDYSQTQKALREHNGSFRSFASSRENPNTPISNFTTPHRGMKQPARARSKAQEPSSTPLSSSESTYSSRSRPRTRRAHNTVFSRFTTSHPHPLRQDQSFLESGSDTDIADEYSNSFGDESIDDVQTCEHLPSKCRPKSATNLEQHHSKGSVDPMRVCHAHGSATPPLGECDIQTLKSGGGSLSDLPRRPTPIATILDSSPAQDASLPSPSLSPITAATNLHPPLSQQSTDPTVEDLIYSPKSPFHSLSQSASQPPDYIITGDMQSAIQPAREDFLQNTQLPNPSTTSIPAMLDAFDALPDNLQTYVMYQFLRRCSKPTLHFVADVVEPTLKCDFLTRLPLELGLQVIRYLDARSMCRAAQVSKKWRHLTDSDEVAWKNLLDTDGFVLPEGEIERAVREGWGWQYPSGKRGWERNISSRSSQSSSKVSNITALCDTLDMAVDHDDSDTNKHQQHSSTRKRKALSKPPSLKKQKRHHLSHIRALPASWSEAIYHVQGPHAYANAAVAMVPNPRIGLPSLQSLHLFKSIYRRHFSIRQGWMDPDTKPLHLAFRARQRNTVTCLQFDSEKVLTGSDDSNIDIYDTQTGASLKQLVGHEGGVWALEYLDNILVSGSTDRSVRIWNMDEGKCLHVFQGHTSTVRCLQILKPVKVGENSDGSPIMMPKQPLIITGSRDSTCRIWKLPKIGDEPFYQTGPAGSDFENPYFVRTLTGHVHSVRAIAAHADTLVSGSYDSTVRVWKISNGELVHRLQGHTTKVYSVVLDYERRQCISGSMDNYVKVWSLETGSCLFNLEGHTSLVGLLDLRDDTLVSAAADSTLRIWDPETGKCKHILSAHTGAITCFSHDGRKVISGSERLLKMWNARTGEWVRDLLTDLSGVWQIKFDERRCIAAVQRDDWTYIEVLDFGACRDGVSEELRGRRIVVDSHGREIPDPETFTEPLHTQN